MSENVFTGFPPRYAHITDKNAGEVANYLPENFKVLRVDQNGQGLIIVGNDNAGWTLDDYVIPRLASGLIAAREVWPVFTDEEDHIRMSVEAGDVTA